MNSKTKRRNPDVVCGEGRPSAVILRTDESRQMLERLEDIEDLNMLESMRKRSLRFKKLANFVKEYHPGV